MAEPVTQTTAEEPKIKQPENPKTLIVNRNEKDVSFLEQRTTRGASAGKTVFEPDISDKQKFLDWVGIDNVIGIVKQKVRSLTIGWADEALDDDTNVFRDAVFLQLAQSFDATGETMEELRDQQKDFNQQLLSIDFSKNDEASRNLLVELGLKLQNIQIAINKKSRKKKSDSEVQAQAA